MKICLVHEEYPEETNFGGIATYQKNLAEELVKKGNEVYVICRGLTHNQFYIENGVKIYRIFNKKNKNQLQEYKHYRKKVCKILRYLQKSKKIDLIEVPDWGAETVYFEKYRKIPLVVRLHTPLKVWLKYNKNNFGTVTKKLLIWEETMLKSADRITCCSQALKELIIKEFDIRGSDILVNPNPANITNFYRDKKITKKNKILFVGSLEERKGICVLAQAINSVLKKYPELEFDFIGKDTTRNNFNCSTKELVFKIVYKKYHKNLNFIGQIPNNNLNYYLNSSLVGVFPSLFDNFPYVVLEAMATGLYVVGSKNSGMVEMINNNSFIYETGNHKDLSNKIIYAYEKALKKSLNKKNIIRLKSEYSASLVCEEIYEDYKLLIKNYYSVRISKKELKNVLFDVTKERILGYRKIIGGVANKVYVVKTFSKKYVIKKYLYDYDFSLADDLYKIYEKNGINFIKPINNSPIHFGGAYYNIFKYIKPSKKNIIDFNFLEKIVLCDKSGNYLKSNRNNIVYKVNFYADYLKKIKTKNLRISLNELNYVLNIYENIKNNDFINETVINHGDISYSNILCTKRINYIIDFDETCYANKLYDFSVIVVKFFQKDGVFNKKLYMDFKDSIREKTLIKEEYFSLSLKFYLCKILLEKFYFFQIEKINLYDKIQLKDNYKIYYKLLKYINKNKL